MKYNLNGELVSVERLLKEISDIQQEDGGVVELIDIVDNTMYFETTIYGIYE